VLLIIDGSSSSFDGGNRRIEGDAVPFLSIITVTLNNAASLKRTVESVARNAPKDSEYIVIDGASTDETVPYLSSAGLPVDCWISEPDCGIYDAMNKGIARARGAFCLFLNAGDILLETCDFSHFLDDGNDVYYSDALLIDGDNRSLIEYPAEVDVNFFVSGMINHQSCIIRKSAFDRYGPYDSTYRICADWLFFLKATHASGGHFAKIPGPICGFSMDGVSTAPGSCAIVEEEHRRGVLRTFGILAPTILELLEFRDSVYGRILRQYGAGPSLGFFLRAYRFLARRGLIRKSGQ
jgi:glycosyltransferase involved in cell wall biosynthesis